MGTGGIFTLVFVAIGIGKNHPRHNLLSLQPVNFKIFTFSFFMHL
jgi:hypothetical protein